MSAATSATAAVAPAHARRLAVPAAIVSLGTAAAILGVALVVLLGPWFVHPALDAAESAAWLGVSPAEAHDLSDATTRELVFGPGTFALAGPDGAPFYGADEAAHLRDARVLLFAFLALGVGGAVAAMFAVVRGPQADAWRAVGRGGAALAITLAVLGASFAVAFEPAFELFHRVFFAGGNWAFDPTTQRLVQLYPQAFWQVAVAGLGAIGIVLGAVTWVVARRRAR